MELHPTNVFLSGKYHNLKGFEFTYPTKHHSLVTQRTAESWFPLRVVQLTRRCGYCCHPASWDRTVLQFISPGKDQNANFEVWILLNIYCFYTMVKLKKKILNCAIAKSGTIHESAQNNLWHITGENVSCVRNDADF